MKKIIFFVCLFLGIVPLRINAESELLCDGVSFDIVYHDGEMVVSKKGENHFMRTYSYLDYSIGIAGVSCEDDTYTFYGYAHGNDSINYYDAFLLVLDHSGSVLFEQVMDYGENEEVTGAVWIDQVLFTITRIDDLGDRPKDIEPQFQRFVI